jgi:hypothetical protein
MVKSIEGLEHKKSEFTIDDFNDHSNSANHELMFKVAMYLADENHKQIDQLFDQTVRCALKKNETEFAWKVLLYGIQLENKTD